MREYMHKTYTIPSFYNGIKKYTTQYYLLPQYDSGCREAFRDLLGGLVARFFL
jgi:hypothetical protein